LAEGKTPAVVDNAKILLPDGGEDLNNADVDFYDPWKNKWVQGKAEGDRISLPDFTRSLVVRMRY
jgi:hypothetical protein